MSQSSLRKMKKLMKAYVRAEYDKELKGMCNYPFWRRVKIALRIILGNA
jgi:hypothetical protein